MYVANKAAQTVEYKKQENRGRRRNTWQHDPETKMKETGNTWEELYKMTTNITGGTMVDGSINMSLRGHP